MKKISILLTAPLMLSVLSAPAHADPEQAFKGGKTAAGLPKVDDRDAEQRVRDYLKEKGRQHGAALLGSGDNSKAKPARPSRKP